MLKATGSVWETDPDVPVIESVYVPAVKLLASMLRDAVAGKELTDAGLRLQLPAP